jgi:hypothetical protein
MDAKTSNTPSPSPTTKTSRPPRRIVTYTILGGAALTLIAVLGLQRQSRAVGIHAAQPAVVAPVPRAPEPPAPLAQAPVANARPRVELVFALDTTGSMTGLIEGAKEKIWSLASFVAQGQPTPDLRRVRSSRRERRWVDRRRRSGRWRNGRRSRMTGSWAVSAARGAPPGGGWRGWPRM